MPVKKHVAQATKAGIFRAPINAFDSSKTGGNRRMLEAITSEQCQLEEKGQTYAARAFNLLPLLGK